MRRFHSDAAARQGLSLEGVPIGGHSGRTSERRRVPTEQLMEIAMLISSAWAAHGVVGTGSSAGGNALLIILGVGIALGLLYKARKKWRRRGLKRDGVDEQRDQ